MPVPARERAPRDDHENFYWLQEDYLKAQAAQHGFTWTILRPQLIIGRPWGVAMNLAPIIGAYAAICQEEGRPFSFTGGVPYVWEAVDARLVADVIDWAGHSPAAVNEHFNVTNGDVFEWRHLWPGMAEVLGVEVGPDEPQSMAELLPEQDRRLGDDRRQTPAAPDRAIRHPRRIALLRGLLLRPRRHRTPTTGVLQPHQAPTSRIHRLPRHPGHLRLLATRPHPPPPDPRPRRLTTTAGPRPLRPHRTRG